MALLDIDFPISISTSYNDPISDLFVPMLSNASHYDVAIGYFTSGWIRDAAEGLAVFAANNGHSRWIISPLISEDDWTVLREPLQHESHCQFAVERDIDQLIRELKEATLIMLSWLIIDGIVDFRLGVPKNKLKGIFHAKFGVASDADGGRVAFSGSYNLTGASSGNWEYIDVFSSSDHGNNRRIEDKRTLFETMWNGDDPNLSIYRPSQRISEKFIQITNEHPRPYTRYEQDSRDLSKPTIPDHYLDSTGHLKPHQEKAISAWFQANGRGILNMATGSGKTVVALAIASKLAERVCEANQVLTIVITVPFRHLAEQWKSEAQAFGFDPILCFSDYPDWPARLGESINAQLSGAATLIMVIVVNLTFGAEKFQHYMKLIRGNALFVGDEMHRLGTENYVQMLPTQPLFRLGLSATPYRQYDDEGSLALRSYFGDEVFHYTIGEAIADGTLTPYRYHPIIVELTAAEMDRYREISRNISKAYARDSDFSTNSYLQSQLMRRARLLSSADNKFEALLELLNNNKHIEKTLIYVGDGSDDNDERLVDTVQYMVGKQLSMRTQKFTAGESKAERNSIVSRFVSGDLQAIIAIRCLDEGIDIPSIETAVIMASSTNPRQFIQRRGRVLRRSPNKSYARIYDFIVVPYGVGRRSWSTDTDFKIEQKLFRSELLRIKEFANTAQNQGDALSVVWEVQKQMDLIDL